MISDRLFWSIMIACFVVLGICECGPVLKDCGEAFGVGEETGR